jgi:hypothetical protein
METKFVKKNCTDLHQIFITKCQKMQLDLCINSGNAELGVKISCAATANS